MFVTPLNKVVEEKQVGREISPLLCGLTRTWQDPAEGPCPSGSARASHSFSSPGPSGRLNHSPSEHHRPVPLAFSHMVPWWRSGSLNMCVATLSGTSTVDGSSTLRAPGPPPPAPSSLTPTEGERERDFCGRRSSYGWQSVCHRTSS